MLFPAEALRSGAHGILQVLPGRIVLLRSPSTVGGSAVGPNQAASGASCFSNVPARSA